jgi:signal transduction histidine kinase
MKLQSASIFLKLLLVFVIQSLVLFAVIVGFIRHVNRGDSERNRAILSKNILKYAKLLVREIGNPPRIEVAKSIADDLDLQIRIETEGIDWASDSKVPYSKEIFEWQKHPRQGLRIGDHHGKLYAIYPTQNGEIIFSSESQPLWRMRNDVVISVVAGLSIALLLSYLSARKIFRPIRALHEGMLKVAAGNFEHRVPIQSRDELGELASTFNDMSRQLQEMVAAKGQLLLDVSHELRSPITRMKMVLEFLDEGKYVSALRDDMNEMESLVSSLLENERLASMHGNLSISKLDLRTLVTEVASQFAGRAPGIQCPENTSSVMLDNERFRIVLRNLFENALKYSSHQSKPVEVSIENKRELTLLKIRDFGIGIPEKEKELVFEPFYRVDKSRVRLTGGFGLGLSLCRRIVQAHGGKIELYSEEGKGTTVVVELRTP